jgi:hypothetical protein
MILPDGHVLTAISRPITTSLEMAIELQLGNIVMIMSLPYLFNGA